MPCPSIGFDCHTSSHRVGDALQVSQSRRCLPGANLGRVGVLVEGIGCQPCRGNQSKRPLPHDQVGFPAKWLVANCPFGAWCPVEMPKTPRILFLSAASTQLRGDKCFTPPNSSILLTSKGYASNKFFSVLFGIFFNCVRHGKLSPPHRPSTTPNPTPGILGYVII